MSVVGLTAAGLGAVYVGTSIGLVSVLGSAPAVVLGGIGIYETTRDPSRSGRDKAVRGLVLGVVGVVFWVLAVSLAVAAAA